MTIFRRGVMLATAALLLFGCKDDESMLGENFLNNKLAIQFDTVRNVTTTSTDYDDTLLVRSGASVALIGDYRDPVFGDHKAKTMFSLVPETNTADSADLANAAADSIVLQMKFKGIYYGYDTTNRQTISVHRINDGFDLGTFDSTQLGNINLEGSYNPAPLATTTFRPGTDSTTTHIQVSLGEPLAEEFLSHLNETPLDSVVNEFFKGFYIRARRQEGSSGAICSFNFNHAESHLRLHFHNEENDSLVFYHYLSLSDDNDATYRYNFFEHDYSTGEISNFTTSDEPTFNTGDSLAFLQAMRGINMKVDVGMSEFDLYQQELARENIVINRAILELHTTKRETPVSDTVTYAPPSSITVTEIENEQSVPIVDYYQPAYGLSSPQTYNSEDHKYEILLSGFTHEKILENDTAFTIWVRASQPSISANRAVFYGTQAAVDSLRPKIIITYSQRTNN